MPQRIFWSVPIHEVVPPLAVHFAIVLMGSYCLLNLWNVDYIKHLPYDICEFKGLFTPTDKFRRLHKDANVNCSDSQYTQDATKTAMAWTKHFKLDHLFTKDVPSDEGNQSACN